jgi:hypothetical protein
MASAQAEVDAGAAGLVHVLEFPSGARGRDDLLRDWARTLAVERFWPGEELKAYGNVVARVRAVVPEDAPPADAAWLIRANGDWTTWKRGERAAPASEER